MPELRATTYHLVCLGPVPDLPITGQSASVSWGDRVVHIYRLDAGLCAGASDRSVLAAAIADLVPDGAGNGRWLYALDWQNLDWFLDEPAAWPAIARPLVASGKRPAEVRVLAALAAGLDGYIPQEVPALDLGRLVKQLFRN